MAVQKFEPPTALQLFQHLRRIFILLENSKERRLFKSYKKFTVLALHWRRIHFIHTHMPLHSNKEPSVLIFHRREIRFTHLSPLLLLPPPPLTHAQIKRFSYLGFHCPMWCLYIHVSLKTHCRAHQSGPDSDTMPN